MESIFYDGLIELLGGAVGEVLIERKNDSQRDAEGLDEIEVLIEGVYGEGGTVWGDDFGGMAVESQDDAWEVPGLGKGDGFFDEGLMTKVDTVECTDADDSGGPFRLDMIGTKVDEHRGDYSTWTGAKGTVLRRLMLVNVLGCAL